MRARITLAESDLTKPRWNAATVGLVHEEPCLARELGEECEVKPRRQAPDRLPAAPE